MSDSESLVGGVVSGGIQYEWTPGPDKASRFDAACEYAYKSKSHLWIGIATYHLTEKSLANIEQEKVHMDMENLMMVTYGCFICEEPYTRKIAKRACKGEPHGK